VPWDALFATSESETPSQSFPDIFPQAAQFAATPPSGRNGLSVPSQSLAPPHTLRQPCIDIRIVEAPWADANRTNDITIYTVYTVYSANGTLTEFPARSRNQR